LQTVAAAIQIMMTDQPGVLGVALALHFPKLGAESLHFLDVLPISYAHASS